MTGDHGGYADTGPEPVRSVADVPPRATRPGYRTARRVVRVVVATAAATLGVFVVVACLFTAAVTVLSLWQR